MKVLKRTKRATEIYLTEEQKNMYKVNIDDREFSVEPGEPGTATINDQEMHYDLKPRGNNAWHLILNNRSFNVRLIDQNAAEHTLTFLINNRSYTLSVRDQFDELLDKMGMSLGDAALLNELKAPMPGLVVDVVAEPGTAVEKGDTLLILEAMKMENVIKASGAATVKALHIEKGQSVEKNQLLMSFEQ